jgi:repressor LexA
MIEDHIADGDYVIIERRETARDGETVVALLDDGQATLKRFYKERGRIRLQPANAAMAPIYVDKDVKIQGVLIGVLRTYSRGAVSRSSNN